MAEMTHDEISALVRFRSAIREILGEGYLTPYYDHIHILFYDRHAFMREWLEFTSADEPTNNQSPEQRIETARQTNGRVTNLSAQELSLRIRQFIRERTHKYSHGC